MSIGVIESLLYRSVVRKLIPLVLSAAPNVSNMRSESSLHGNAALVRASIVIVKGQSFRKGFEASVSIYV